MTDPVRAGDAPIPVEVEEGKNYFWCTCGQSSKQPFCDGSHAGSGHVPLRWTAPESKRVFFCACASRPPASPCATAATTSPHSGRGSGGRIGLLDARRLRR